MNYFGSRRVRRALLGDPSEPEEPISAELFSVERLEHYAEALAANQEVMPAQSAGISLHGRLRSNAAVLHDAYRALVAGMSKAQAVTPAAAWLVDNYYIVDEHVRAIRRDLPAGFYKQLPKLAHGRLREYPRVYGLAWALVAHTDSRFELETVFRFCRSYQRVQALTIGELWAIAITLRLILIENLRRLAAGIVHRKSLREQADALADKLLNDDSAGAAQNLGALRDWEHGKLPNAFAAQLFQRLRDHDPATTPALLWLHTRLAAQGTTADEVVHNEHHRQGAVNVSVRNVITSLRLISAVDWAKFVESVSVVDDLLRAESEFAAFDFASRDLYRHAIEDLARGSNLSELDVTGRALAAAKNAIAGPNTEGGGAVREGEAGYYLVAGGRGGFERQLGYEVPWSQRLARWNRAAGIGGYVCSLVVTSVLIVAASMWFGGWPHQELALAVAFGLLAFVQASDVAVAAVNLWVTRTSHAAILPGLELADGVPAELRTIVAIPILLSSVSDIDEHLRGLEVHYLASQDGDLRFALLSDWVDADEETRTDDDTLLKAASAGIGRLNRTYGDIEGDSRFLLMHRRRQWNERQRRWMGWERKRGKLQEFNRLLLGAKDTSFIPIDGIRPKAPSGVRYVISLDADTRLPRGAALRLIGKMAHPLNKPQFNPNSRKVVAGYAILQPRVTPSLSVGREASIFQSVFSGRSGIDPYAFAVSDVYQDLFGEGSYSGKGIYDVAFFEAALEGRVRENRLLSHDLFEGIYARCGLASDVEIVEEYPPRYDVAAARQHRWTRGDWQLLPWILGRNAALPALGRWKMLDNLRRSLAAPAALLTCALAWTGPSAVRWSIFVIAALALPTLLPLAAGLVPSAADFSSRSYLGALRNDVKQAAALIALRFVFLADEAWLMADAVLRTMMRLAVTRRNLLQWTTAAQSKAGLSFTAVGFYRRMSGGLLLVVAAMLFDIVETHRLPLIAIPFLATWLCAPIIARRVSLPGAPAVSEPLSPSGQAALRKMARQTWSFFDTFVTAKQNMLPPDNFQEIPHAVIANRTSPTNIGLYLLSVVAARELGWIGTLDAVERLEATLVTLGKLERFRGHFYNWYDTHDLRPLDPKYISTVDSGNLAAHLVALEGSCRDWMPQAPFNADWRRGIEDTVDLTYEFVHALNDGRRNYGVAPAHLESALNALRASLRAAAGDLPAAGASLSAMLRRADEICDIARAITDERGEGGNAPLLKWSEMLRANVASHARDGQAVDLAGRLNTLANQVHELAYAMDFGFLVDPDKKLLSIGFRVAERSLDSSCYDLLASEARLASFFGIAKGDLPVRHWFRLGRLLTAVDRGLALVSWSGSMFEYLMPILVMREPAGSVLGETSRLVVRRQIEYGSERKLPWGISECAFNARDLEFTYQYMGFGVPGLGLQRGLSEDAVVAPYATALAAMIDAAAACRNFTRLAEIGARGRFGWYDAVDFTPARLPEGKDCVAVRTYMAHHQGMILLSIANVLCDGIMRARFHADPRIQATELLLQERTPRDSVISPPRADEIQAAPELLELAAAVPRRFSSPHHVTPRTHLLSNGNYSVMITAAGSGYSRWQDVAVTRWREDPTRDHWGSYVFLRDVASGQVWSAGYQPVGREPDSYDVAYYEDRAEITRQDGRIITATEIVVSPEDNAEVRRITLTNVGTRAREIELTTYAEVVLATAAADTAHPAFSKLFVQTEFVAQGGVLLATRRVREPGEIQLWIAHVSTLEGTAIGGIQFETDRARFLGRGRDLRDAVSIVDARPLSNTAGTVLDPVLSLRRRIRVAPGESARVAFWTILTTDRAQAIALADKYRDTAVFERAKTLAWTQAQVQLRYLGIDFDEAQLFQRIANRVLYADPVLRAARDVLARNRSGPSVLWMYGISGDLPIVLVIIDDSHDLEIVRQLLRAHEYWRSKRLAVDLVIVNNRPPSYVSDLQQGLDAAIRTSKTRLPGDDTSEPARGGVFVLRGELMSESDRELLQTAARALLVARRGTLNDQLARIREPEPLPRLRNKRTVAGVRPGAARTLPELEFFNGLGGFAADGREYVTLLDEAQWTPAPWINVIANPRFGFQVSADGTGSTWSINARENQLTPWSNDPISNTPAEVIYICDADAGDLWSATPLPIRETASTYVIRHGFGYSRFEHSSHEIETDLLQFVPTDDPVKISRLKISNRSRGSRRLSVTHYLDWVLGSERAKSAFFTITEIESRTGALLARNPWNTEFHQRVSFMDMAGRQQTCTGDRSEFIGRHGTLAEPAALLGSQPLSNRVGAGLDPCGAMQTTITLRAGEETELVFLLGEGASKDDAMAIIDRYRAVDLDTVLKSVTDFWDQTVGVVQVKTPDRSMDILVNGWLQYQTLACRLWARSGFYQSSGAYGFRDQLQDVMALCVSRPALAREHILRAAARQFEAGDVQHWWLPTTGRGVRTRVSDDRIWLPYVVAYYLRVTADAGVLDEMVSFLESAPLTADQTEDFAAPGLSPTTKSLYEHCALALDSSLAIGSHGLPLFGTGDWNDGMNRVGAGGTGESVWLGWFLYAALTAFAEVADRREDSGKAVQWRKHAFAVQQSIEREAWDGDWYRRGYFDDGTPLGSVSSDECRIDSIAQSWAVISAAAERSRAVRAMSAVNAQLVSRSDGLVQLFTPPFDRSSHDPGYIKAYPPGIRENGGQYTHASMWTTLAFALLGDGDMAGELFSLINPINHSSTRAGIHRYKVEPYVACADVYAAAPHIGRGGWTWYTGTAGWMYRAAVEGILGLHVKGESLSIDPCVSRGWSGFEIIYKYRSSRYLIAVENPHGVNRGIKQVSLDDVTTTGKECLIQLQDDGREHRVRIQLG